MNDHGSYVCEGCGRELERTEDVQVVLERARGHWPGLKIGERATDAAEVCDDCNAILAGIFPELPHPSGRQALEGHEGRMRRHLVDRGHRSPAELQALVLLLRDFSRRDE